VHQLAPIHSIPSSTLSLTHLLQIQNSNPSYASIAPNEVVKIECVDWTGGQIGNNDSANDVRDVDLSKIHYLTGPFDIETAEPGDVLVVEIQDVQPLEEAPWGFTGIFGKTNGGGFLDEIYPEP
jgi:formamidase